MPVITAQSISLTMINGLGQLALVAVLYGIIRRLDIGRHVQWIALGVLFGSGAILAMLTSAPVAPGVLIDTRAIMVGLAGAFAGTLAGLVAGAIAILFRLWLGGAGVTLGSASIAIAMIAGIAWAKLLPRRRRDGLFGLLLLGVAIALHSLVALLSPRLGADFLALFFPLIWSTSLFATLALGWMMQRENELILREKSLADFAYTDALTGIANRRAFDRRLTLDEFLGRKGPLGVIIADIDHFKSINDSFGHDAGDAVLVAVAQLIQNELRETDLVARHGGEEFAILLPATDLAAARMTAERIRERIAAMAFSFAGQKIAVTASFGLAVAGDGRGRKTLVTAADTALYRAKSLGRNRVELADTPPASATSGAVSRQAPAGATLWAPPAAR